jgi:hypothetical protein
MRGGLTTKKTKGTKNKKLVCRPLSAPPRLCERFIKEQISRRGAEKRKEEVS